MTASTTRLWQTLTFRDCDAMMSWLAAIGFTEHATYRDEQDPSVVVHAEWVWPGGGGIMFGSPRPDSPVAAPGASSTYLVTEDPDGVFARAVAAGASVDREVVDQDHGGRGGSVRDPEGNRWSFGDYQPS
ncbi:glyoxalase/bleomycin resistance/extradiol dioxygenase family protein [Nocardioides sp. SYSU D00038]|uniref:VOC family protein n=1 Tax=Nocardioides sp. SYSU D00038 TaxID=2812554 RepID=UPI00196757D8|nr:VOC family protein [Nocardioides sp. SYSU D00038]